jgi:hypothetical protein
LNNSKNEALVVCKEKKGRGYHRNKSEVVLTRGKNRDVITPIIENNAINLEGIVLPKRTRMRGSVSKDMIKSTKGKYDRSISVAARAAIAKARSSLKARSSPGKVKVKGEVDILPPVNTGRHLYLLLFICLSFTYAFLAGSYFSC